MQSPMMGKRGLAARTILLMSAALALGCVDAPVSPQRPAAPPSLLSVREALQQVDIIELATPLAQDVTVGGWIGRKGGYIGIPEAGMWLVVPEGAVKRRTYFTLTARAGKLVSYEFGPHGTTFSKPLQVYQDLLATNVGAWADESWTGKQATRDGWSSDGTNDQLLKAGYFPDWSAIDAEKGTATVLELLPAQVNIFGRFIKFDVHHFSGYLLASGRSGQYAQ